MYGKAPEPSGRGVRPIEPDNLLDEPGAWITLGCAAEAEAALWKIIETDPRKRDVARAQLLVVLFAQGRFPEAIGIGEDLIARGVADRYTVANTALALQQLGSITEARDTFQELQLCEGGFLDLEECQMACCATRLGDYREALRLLCSELVLDNQVRYASEHAAWNNHLGARYHILWALRYRPTLILEFFRELGDGIMELFLRELLLTTKEDRTFLSRMDEIRDYMSNDKERAWQLLQATPEPARDNGLYKHRLACLLVTDGGRCPEGFGRGSRELASRCSRIQSANGLLVKAGTTRRGAESSRLGTGLLQTLRLLLGAAGQKKDYSNKRLPKPQGDNHSQRKYCHADREKSHCLHSHGGTALASRHNPTRPAFA